jgi:hypothetical protein
MVRKNDGLEGVWSGAGRVAGPQPRKLSEILHAPDRRLGVIGGRDAV